MHRNSKLAASALVCLLSFGLLGQAIALERPALDRAMAAKASPAAQAALDRAMADPALRGVARVSQTESRYALPTFLWATGSGTPGRRSAAAASLPSTRSAASAARGHMSRIGNKQSGFEIG